MLPSLSCLPSMAKGFSSLSAGPLDAPRTDDLTELLWFDYRAELRVDYVSLSELERYVDQCTAEDGTNGWSRPSRSSSSHWTAAMPSP